MILSLILVFVSIIAFTNGQQNTTQVYFLYQTAAGLYPAVCSSGVLNAIATGNTGTNTTGLNVGTYNITSVASGNHTYYNSASVPSITQTLSSNVPATCEGYTATNTLPITSAGLNLQYGSTCINLYNSSGTVKADPDSLDATVSVFYSTQPLSVSCPQPIAPTASGSVCVGFTYTLNAGNGGSVVCGAGVLNCQSFGSNEYSCSSLNQGTQYFYNSTSQSTTSISLSSQVECNSFGDGYLPLDYEGISFSGSFGTAQNCISIYNTKNATTNTYYPRINYDFLSQSFPATFSYGTSGYSSAAAACATYIPTLNNANTTTAANFSCLPGTTTNQNNAMSLTVSLFSIFATLFIACTML